MRIAMVAAEISGDNLAASLIRALRYHDSNLEISGICGPAMIAEGARALYTIEDISSIGVESGIQKIRKILKIRKNLISKLLVSRPDVFIGVDAPDFNLSVECQLRKAGIPTVQYVAPTVWAWRGYRTRKVSRAVSKLLTIYPFESNIYKQAEIPFTYVGHPLADELKTNNIKQCRLKYGFADDDAVIALLPGSRNHEVKMLSGVFIQTAMLIAQTDNKFKFIIPYVNQDHRELLNSDIKRLKPSFPIILVERESHDVMKAADFLIVASGTAVLEAALMHKPLIVAYRVSKLTYLLVQLFKTSEYYSVLNHFEKKPIIPEYMQQSCVAENLFNEFTRLSRDSSYRGELLNKFRKIGRDLKLNANKRAAAEIIKMVKHD